MEMNTKSKNVTLATFAKNKENPFLKEAIEKIESGIVKKYKSASGTSKSAILQAINADGELVGHTSFVQQIQVDEEQFTKIYLSQFSAFFELKSQGIKVFGYIMTQLIPKKDLFTFFIEDCMEYTGYTSEKSVYIGLSSLLESRIIARGRNENFYFINPMIAFNGDRVSFTKTYVKKLKKEDPNQLNMFEETSSRN